MSDIIAYSILLYISISYVSAIYITSKDINDYKLSRDDPRVIKSRMRKISILTIFNIFFIPLLQKLFGANDSNKTYIDYLMELGIVPGRQFTGVWNIILYFKNCYESILLICQLFIGPLSDSLLYHLAINGSGLGPMIDSIYSLFNTIWNIRNYIFAPITEEIFYTSFLITSYQTLFKDGTISFKRYLFEPPLYFGIAHAHHAYETYNKSKLIGNGPSIITIGISTLFQMSYTYIFGILTNFIFIITSGNLWSCIILHSICNIMGFPGGSELQFHYSVIKPLRDTRSIRLLSIWNKIYIGLLLLGIILFVKGLNNFTTV
ncbi:hypothetical protein C6P45_001182 [Maudiozyma exigua]|uniref:intramembrane prenyl-peptidase Rce1 n=1 Tax=Maudiozyma exigua TaxID=34358 RepID=A0A9P7BCL6_MAUEX|nr:hypothetical protein C6P45_001182 [Kazachstania exigua]